MTKVEIGPGWWRGRAGKALIEVSRGICEGNIELLVDTEWGIAMLMVTHGLQ
jgi:hypothetical protein